MSPLYPFIYVIFQLVAGATAAGHGLHDVMDGIRQRQVAVFGTMEGKSSIFSEIPALSNRYLQDMGGSEDGFTDSQCSNMIQSDDDFEENAYGSNSSATCNCTKRDNVYDVVFPLIVAVPNETTATQDEIDAYVLEYNNEIGNIRSNTTISCTTECSVCFADPNMTPSAFCGVLSYSKMFRLRGGVSGNITWEDILSDLNTSNAKSNLLIVSSLGSETCVDFTSGSTGTLCFRSNVNVDMNQALTCAIAYNGVTCNSCEVVESATDTCVIADCTNLSPSTVLDSCNKTGFIGPFAFLPLWSEAGNTTNYTLGNCDVSSTRPPPAPANSTSTFTSNGCNNPDLFTVSGLLLASSMLLGVA